jgi:hypothetical protein
MKQIKKNPNDPDFENLNPDIVHLARTNGTIKQCIELYLDGKATWLEATETMVLLLAKEYRAQQTILVQSLRERTDLALLSVGNHPDLRKALPSSPLKPHGTQP